MRKIPSRRLLALSIAAAAAFAMTACTDDDEDDNANGAADSSDVDDADDGEDGDDAAQDVGALSDDEFIQCTYLGIDFMEIGGDLSQLNDDEIRGLAEATDAYVEMADHSEILASATDLSAMLHEAADNPSDYVGGSDEMNDLTEEVSTFSDLCATHSPEEID